MAVTTVQSSNKLVKRMGVFPRVSVLANTINSD